MKRLVLAAVAAALGCGVAAAQTAPASQAQPATATPAKLPEGITEEMRVQANDIDRLLARGDVFLLDVREPKELEELGTRPGYVNIPLGQLEARLDELPKDKTILTA
jgi:3-mercaptopyruvate sulfurtransferase SseA